MKSSLSFKCKTTLICAWKWTWSSELKLSEAFRALYIIPGLAAIIRCMQSFQFMELLWGKISLTPQYSVFVFFVGKVILASTKAVYVLVPLPLERQIQDLLANHRVEEALILTEGAQRNIPKDKFQVTTCLRRWYVGHTVHLLSLLENLNMLILLPKLILLSFIKENIFHNYKLDSLLNCHFLLLQNLHKRILQQAGFIQFGQLQFLEAKEHFR